MFNNLYNDVNKYRDNTDKRYVNVILYLMSCYSIHNDLDLKYYCLQVQKHLLQKENF